jgi:hypothetical protein
LLLSGFPALLHVLPLFPVQCGALHAELYKPPHRLGQRMSSLVVRILPGIR